MRSVAVHLRLPAELLAEIDAAARANYTSRSDFIRESMVIRLKNQQLTPVPKVKDVLAGFGRAGT